MASRGYKIGSQLESCTLFRTFRDVDEDSEITPKLLYINLHIASDLAHAPFQAIVTAVSSRYSKTF